MSEIEARIGDNRGFLAAVGFTGDDVLSLKQTLREHAKYLQSVFRADLHIEDNYYCALKDLKAAHKKAGFGVIQQAIDEVRCAINHNPRWRARSVDAKAGRTRHKMEHLHEDAHHADVAAFDLYERLKSNEEALKRNGLTVRYAGAMLLYILGYDAEKPESKGREEASIGRFDTRRRAGERFTWLAEGCLHT